MYELKLNNIIEVTYLRVAINLRIKELEENIKIFDKLNETITKHSKEELNLLKKIDEKLKKL